MNLKGNIVITLEDILFESAKSLGKFIRNNYYPTFCNKLAEIPFEYEFENRQFKSLLMSRMTKEQHFKKYSLTAELLKELYYLKDNVFENYIETSELYNKICKSESFLESNAIEHIYIVYTSNPEMDVTMKNILEKYFNHKKFVLVKVNEDEDIYDFLMKTQWNLLITDSSYLVKMCIEKNENDKKMDLIKKEFLMPKYRYCRLDFKEEVCIQELGGMINYF